MESSRPKEKMKTKEHITPINGDRCEKSEQELNETRKEGSGQSGLVNADRLPMFHWDTSSTTTNTTTTSSSTTTNTTTNTTTSSTTTTTTTNITTTITTSSSSSITTTSSSSTTTTATIK
ncbi:unnamed protein product [Schistosoma margrebowiei]|uniref:Uncharacterized protein n=1 Tax=Schistosoma margrebowiei TaxID=48269 RepID=A0A183L8Z9_9TREM|nr:unnamed protein product [Schistosoma margrebowiei]